MLSCTKLILHVEGRSAIIYDNPKCPFGFNELYTRFSREVGEMINFWTFIAIVNIKSNYDYQFLTNRPF